MMLLADEFAELVARKCPTGSRDEIEAFARIESPEMLGEILSTLETLQRITTIRSNLLC